MQKIEGSIVVACCILSPTLIVKNDKSKEDLALRKERLILLVLKSIHFILNFNSNILFKFRLISI